MWKCWTTGAILSMLLLATPGQAQDRGNRDDRLQKLEKEIADLRAELKKLQAGPATPPRGPDRRPDARSGNRPEARNDQVRRPGPPRPEARGFGQGFRGYGRFQQNPWGPGFGRGNPWGPGRGWQRGQNFRQGWQSPAPWRGGFNRDFAARRNFQGWDRGWNNFAPRSRPGFGPPSQDRRPGLDRPGQPPSRSMERGPDRPRRDPPPPAREGSGRDRGEDNRPRPPA